VGNSTAPHRYPHTLLYSPLFARTFPRTCAYRKPYVTLSAHDAGCWRNTYAFHTLPLPYGTRGTYTVYNTATDYHNLQRVPLQAHHHCCARHCGIHRAMLAHIGGMDSWWRNWTWTTYGQLTTGRAVALPQFYRVYRHPLPIPTTTIRFPYCAPYTCLYLQHDTLPFLDDALHPLPGLFLTTFCSDSFFKTLVEDASASRAEYCAFYLTLPFYLRLVVPRLTARWRTFLPFLCRASRTLPSRHLPCTCFPTTTPHTPPCPFPISCLARAYAPTPPSRQAVAVGGAGQRTGGPPRVATLLHTTAS